MVSIDYTALKNENYSNAFVNVTNNTNCNVYEAYKTRRNERVVTQRVNLLSSTTQWAFVGELFQPF